jgi:lipopolysaccharide/colanic/teichoic acid biosynthesis glycosyltransferase
MGFNMIFGAVLAQVHFHPTLSDGPSGTVSRDDGIEIERLARCVTTGFRPRSHVVHRAYNLALASLFLVLTFPLMAVIAAALFVTQGREIFYRGARLGKDRETFHIFKFCTLDAARARALTGDRVLPKDANIETPLGRYLRASRLDELPQLLNVFLGHMNIVGPRPVRAEIAKIYEKTIPNYNVRFTVKPGLVGPTQAFMSHGASKQTRARYNNLLCRAPVRYHQEVLLFTVVGLNVIRRAFTETLRALSPGRMHRVAHLVASSLDVEVALLDGSRVYPVRAVCDAYVRIPGLTLGSDGAVMWLSLRALNGHRRRVRIWLSPLQGRQPGFFAMKPLTEYGHHVLERYLLDMALVPERRPAPHVPSAHAYNLLGKSPDVSRKAGTSSLPSEAAETCVFEKSS